MNASKPSLHNWWYGRVPWKIKNKWCATATAGVLDDDRCAIKFNVSFHRTSWEILVSQDGHYIGNSILGTSPAPEILQHFFFSNPLVSSTSTTQGYLTLGYLIGTSTYDPVSFILLFTVISSPGSYFHQSLRTIKEILIKQK